jgi:S-adenosylmethionine:tRNA ribosyltransferase-isomerase
VFPARVRGKKATGGKAELLLLEPLNEARQWRALVRGVTKPFELHFAEGVTAQMHEMLAEGEWRVEFSNDEVRGFLSRHGEMPLPPYIKRPEPRGEDLDSYQTVFAREEGAVAAPTAGFHFTPELLARIEANGVERAEIVLHVGWGTFRPVRTDRVEDHRMLPERYEIAQKVAAKINAAIAEGRRIVAVGTTVVRTLETAGSGGQVLAGSGSSDLFIYPGFAFKIVGALMTNFHLPDSTPLLLANAFAQWRQAKQAASPFVLKDAYQAAVREGYRFYSYGDAMLIQ